jgi:hypothetical protein
VRAYLGSLCSHILGWVAATGPALLLGNGKPGSLANGWANTFVIRAIVFGAFFCLYPKTGNTAGRIWNIPNEYLFAKFCSIHGRVTEDVSVGGVNTYKHVNGPTHYLVSEGFINFAVSYADAGLFWRKKRFAREPLQFLSGRIETGGVFSPCPQTSAVNPQRPGPGRTSVPSEYGNSQQILIREDNNVAGVEGYKRSVVRNEFASLFPYLMKGNETNGNGYECISTEKNRRCLFPPKLLLISGLGCLLVGLVIFLKGVNRSGDSVISLITSWVVSALGTICLVEFIFKFLGLG